MLFLLLVSGPLLLTTSAITDYNISVADTFEVPIETYLPEGQKKLLQLQMLSRHGMRAPDQRYPKSPNPESVWREGLGRLTQHGKYQQYALGKQLRSMYSNFITPSPVELEVLSSQRNRCVLSALCNVAALYKPDDKWEFLPGMPWQPIPVLYSAHGKDPYLGKLFDCPAAHREVKKMYKSEEGEKFIAENKELFKNVTHESGLVIRTWSDAATLYDILSMDKAYNLIIPDWATKHWDRLHYINDMSFYFSAKTKEYQRLRAGPLLGLMRSKMESKINGRTQKKVHLYSGHSKNMVAVLSALDVFNRREPPFCSTLIFELYQETVGHSLRLLFLNTTTPEDGNQKPHLLELPGCGEYCPFRTFSNLVEALEPLDWEEECE